MAQRYFKSQTSSAIIAIDVDKKEEIQNPKSKKPRYVYSDLQVANFLNNGFVEVDSNDPATAKEIKPKKVETKKVETKEVEVKDAKANKKLDV